MREKTPAVSIALANEVLPPSDKERVIRRQISPPNTIHWKGKGLRTAESTAIQEEALGATRPAFLIPYLCALWRKERRLIWSSSAARF